MSLNIFLRSTSVNLTSVQKRIKNAVWFRRLNWIFTCRWAVGPSGRLTLSPEATCRSQLGAGGKRGKRLSNREIENSVPVGIFKHLFCNSESWTTETFQEKEREREKLRYVPKDLKIRYVEDIFRGKTIALISGKITMAQCDFPKFFCDGRKVRSCRSWGCFVYI